MSAQKRKDTPLLPMVADYLPGKTRAAQRIAVAASTAEGIAKPESDWNAANTPRVCGPRSPSIDPA